MFIMNDIYRSIDTKLLLCNYWNIDDNDRKELIDLSLREYLANKIMELDASKNFLFENLVKLRAEELVAFLESRLTEGQKFECLRHVVHYVINLCSSIQEYQVVWEESQDPRFIESPFVFIDNYGKWDRFITHHNTSYSCAFSAVYSTLQNAFNLKK